MSDDDISNDPDGAKYWWQAECKEMIADKITYTSNPRKMFPTVLGCCNEDLRGKVQNRADFDYLESFGNVLSLLNEITQEGYRISST